VFLENNEEAKFRVISENRHETNLFWKKKHWSGEQDLNLRQLGICGLRRLE
jgi:hypothetical protein